MAVAAGEAVEVDAAVVGVAADSNDRTMTTAMVMVANDQTTEIHCPREKVQKKFTFFFIQ